VYAPDSYGSLGVVAKGFCDVLRDSGALAGMFPTNHVVQLSEVDGVDAPIGLWIANPYQVEHIHRLGIHERVFCEYAPNSPSQPIEILNTMLRAKVECVLTPSQWAADALRSSWGDRIDVRVVRHGVHPGFVAQPPPADLPDPFEQFVILHHVGSSPERKGTEQLLQALDAWGVPSLLRVSTSLEMLIPVTELLGRFPSVHFDMTDPVCEPLGWPARAAKQYSTSHIVCQPSRSEGFGMAPLEALACGVPVVITALTGHSEFAGEAGVVQVMSGEPAPMHCEMGRCAPSVSPEAIIDALRSARSHFEGLKSAAMSAAPALAERWSWSSQVSQWLEDVTKEKNR
jgi:glycosyltransferase involved in cell wall biosynthesis